jgi:hypothetical protein
MRLLADAMPASIFAALPRFQALTVLVKSPSVALGTAHSAIVVPLSKGRWQLENLKI